MGTPAPELGPDTNLGVALAAWPELERLLVELSPSFRALADPLLRRTFTKAATLRQAAQAAGVPVAALLAAAETARGGALTRAPVSATPPASEAAPPWTRRAPHARHDARRDVAQGVHPLPAVLAELEALPDGEIYELLTPLVPAPLLGLLAKKGFEAHAERDEAGEFARTLVRRRPG